MNSKTQLAIVALLIGFAVFLILSKPMWWKETAVPVDREAMERMQERILMLERGQESTARALEDVNRSLRTLDRSRLTSTAEGVVMPARKSGDEVVEPGAAPVVARGSLTTRTSGPALTLETALAGVLDRGMAHEDKEALWKQIREAGLTDEVIKELERRVAAKPKDPDAQTDLGNAYLKKLQEVPQGPESGVWATKADQAFDKALEIDPEHWESRFTKAVSLSFWPAALGKGSEAIKNFETLIAQQEHQAPRSGFDYTYYFLGNMYLQQGQRDQAVAMWQRGLKLFPDSAELKRQLANSGR